MTNLNISTIELPGREPLFTGKGWTAFLVALVFVCLCVPLMNLVVPQGHWLHFSDYAVSIGWQNHVLRHLCLGHGFDLGLHRHLVLGSWFVFCHWRLCHGHVPHAPDWHAMAITKANLPDFMVFLDWKELPWHWALSDSFVATLLLVVLVPGVVAWCVRLILRSARASKGVYFSIITQAMTFAAMLLFFRNETGFGGNNGFTDFKRILDLPMATPNTRMTAVCADRHHFAWLFLMARWLIRSKFGRVLQAIRDAESRVMFSGYSPLTYKLSIWVISAVMCGVAGAFVCAASGHHQPR
jgi:urea transport system permease protein